MIRAARLVEHTWALAAPLGSAAGTWRERRSLLLVLEDDAGHFGLGEAAPLPGFTADTLEAARSALVPLLGHALPDETHARDVSAALGRASRAVTSPAARSALEAALLDAWSRRRGLPAYALLAEVAPGTRATLSAWLPDGIGDALAAARSHLAHGGSGLKVKLDARRGLEGGVATLEALRRELGPGVALRADANRSATVATLAPFLERLRALELEWLEEPTAEPLADIGVPLALDESLQDVGAKPDLARRPFVAGLVLKPTALGGIARCLELAAHARAHGRAAVASHALEGPVGFMTGVALAFALGSERAHGLTAHRALRTARPPGLAGEADVLEAWTAPGFGLEAATALAGSEIVREDRA